MLAQVGVMLVVCAIVLVDRRAHLSNVPFSWSYLAGGLGGLSAGFPRWAIHLLGIDGRSTNRRMLDAGTIVILFVYLLATVALPAFMWRRHRDPFSAVRHTVRRRPATSAGEGTTHAAP